MKDTNTIVVTIGFAGKNPTLTKIGPLPLENSNTLSFLRQVSLSPTTEEAKNFTGALVDLLEEHASNWKSEAIEKKNKGSSIKEALAKALADDDVSVQGVAG